METAYRKRTNTLKEQVTDAHLEGLAGLVFLGNLQGAERVGQTEPGSLEGRDANSVLWVPVVPGTGRRRGREEGGKDLTFGTCLPFRPWTPWVPGLSFLSQRSRANNLNYGRKDHHTARQGLGCTLQHRQRHTQFLLFQDM